MSLPKPKLSIRLPSAPTKVGTQATAVKKPKPKKMADPFSKKSLFFGGLNKGEGPIKGVDKLRAFLEKQRSKGTKPC